MEETTEAENEDAPTGNKEESDPFGLDALIPSTSKIDDKSKGKRVTLAKARKGEEEEETKRFLRSQREALISCLEIAANRYRTPWSSIYGLLKLCYVLQLIKMSNTLLSYDFS